MTLENPTTNGASTDYISVSKITKTEPLTSSYVETETPETGSVSDTAAGGTAVDKTGMGTGGLTAENYTQSLLGEKRPWGLDPFDKSYPDELDFSANTLDNLFDAKFNTVPPKGDAPSGADTEKKPDVPGKGKTLEDAPGGEVEEKFDTAPAKAKTAIEIFDPFDPQFNIVPDAPKNTEGEKPDVPKPDVKTEVPKPDVSKPDAEAEDKTDDKKPAPDGEMAQKKPAAPKGGITKTVTDTVTGTVDEASKLPEKALKEGTDLLSGIGSALGFGTDQEAARITGNAEKGRKHADLQDAQYVKQFRGLADNGPIAPPKEGDDPAKYTHTNSDKSSYTVTNGKISDFQTAPTKDHPEGVKYSDIKYDAKGQIESYSSTSLGQTHTRTSAPDANGFANWKATDTKTGKPANYGESSAWRGKPVVDANGMHNLIRSGKFANQMFSRHMDGSQVATKPTKFDARGQITGLETTTTLADNTKVTQQGHFTAATKKWDHADTVKVKEADGPKTSQVKFEAGSEKGALVTPPKPEQNAKGDSMIGMFKDILSPQSLDKMKDIKEMSIQRIGPSSFHIDGNVNNVYMEPPRVTVGGFGPLGRVSATPQGGVVNKFDLNMHIGDKRVDISDVHGVHGTASLARHKRNGSVKGIGSRATTTTGASWDMNSNTLVARSSGGPPTTLDARNFAKGSLTGNLLSNENAEKNAKALLEGLNKNLDSASLKQVKPGVFDASIELKTKQIPIDAKIPNVKANIYLDDKVNFTRSAEGATFKPGEAQLGVQVGKGLEQRKDIAKLSSGTNERGEPVMKIEFHGKHDPMSIPLGKPDAKTGDVKPAVKPTVKPEAVKPAVKPEVVKPELEPAANSELPSEVKPSMAKPEVNPVDRKPASDADQSKARPERQPLLRTERDTRPEPRRTSNQNNNCNEGSHRRRIFGFRRR